MNGQWFENGGRFLGVGVFLTLAAVIGCDSAGQGEVAVAPPEQDVRVAPDLSKPWSPEGPGASLRLPASDAIQPDDSSDVTPSSLQIERGMRADAWECERRFGGFLGPHGESPQGGSREVYWTDQPK